MVYSFWVKEGKPKITNQFIDSVEAYFDSRPRSKWRLSALNSDNWNYDLYGYPSEDQNPLKTPKSKTSRNKKNPLHQEFREHVNYVWNEATQKAIRRYIKRGDEVCFAVSLGAFPK